MKPRTVDLRTREIAAIHAAKRDLGMDEETYRAMLRQLTGFESSAALDAVKRRKVLDHLKAKGWKGSKRRAAPAKDKAPMISKIRALLINHPDGAKPDAYADGIAKRMFSVERLEWCDAEQLYKIIQALEVDKRRRQ